MTAGVANGCLYLIGGEGNDAHEMGVFDLNERYDPIANTWHSEAPLPLAMHGITGRGLPGRLDLRARAARRGAG